MFFWILSNSLSVMVALGWGRIHSDLSRWAQGYTLERLSALPTGPFEVSVVIPARDEAHNIQSCLDSLICSEGVQLQVIVVDDGSIDDTRLLVEECCAIEPTVSLIQLEEHPSSWSGKSRACWEGAKVARHEWLLFLDADVRVHPEALARTCQYAYDNQVGLLSVFGTWELVSIWERMLIPTIGWFIRGTVGLTEVNHGKKAFANGQYMLFQKATYQHINGHQSVRGAVLDDVGLARVVTQAGEKLALLSASWCFRVRLYRGLWEIIFGYSKNLFEGMDRNGFVALFSIVFLVLFSILPMVMLGVSLHYMHLSAAVLWFASVVMMMGFRYRLERRDHRDNALIFSVIHPIGVAVFIGIILNSMIRRRVHWKGRVFDKGQMRR